MISRRVLAPGSRCLTPFGPAIGTRIHPAPPLTAQKQRLTDQVDLPFPPQSIEDAMGPVPKAYRTHLGMSVSY